MFGLTNALYRAFVIFPFVGVAIFSFVFHFYFKKQGYLHTWTVFVFFLFVFYCIVALFLVVLPLPDFGSDVCQTYAYIQPQLIPFASVFSDIPNQAALLLGENNPSLGTILSTLWKNQAFRQIIFNCVLLFPLGVFLRYFWKCSRKATILISFGTSLFFELSQLTGNWGMYDCAYRVFDVDDLIWNTGGAMLGFWATGLLLPYFPKLRLPPKQKNIF